LAAVFASASGNRPPTLPDYVTRFGRLRRRKIVLPRENILKSAVDIFKTLAEVCRASILGCVQRLTCNYYHIYMHELDPVY
jgi:hypothetical protein